MAIGDLGSEVLKAIQGLFGGGQQPPQQPSPQQQTAPLGGNATTIPQQVQPPQQTPAAPQAAPAPAATQDTSSSIPPEIYQMAQAMRPPTTGVAGFLNNPLVQGALSAYLSGISSPRVMGWGGALGRGGLAGLQAFSAAEKAQDDDLTKAAGVWKDVQTGKEAATSTEHTALLNRQLQQIPILNHRSAELIRQQAAKEKDPEIAQAKLDAAAMVEQDDSKLYGPKDISDLTASIWTNRKAQVDVQEGKARLPLIGAQTDEARANAARAAQEGAAAGVRAQVDALQLAFDRETNQTKKDQLAVELQTAKDRDAQLQQELKQGPKAVTSPDAQRLKDFVDNYNKTHPASYTQSNRSRGLEIRRAAHAAGIDPETGALIGAGGATGARPGLGGWAGGAGGTATTTKPKPTVNLPPGWKDNGDGTFTTPNGHIVTPKS